jgi:hypothetical protein
MTYERVQKMEGGDEDEDIQAQDNFRDDPPHRWRTQQHADTRLEF